MFKILVGIILAVTFVVSNAPTRSAKHYADDFNKKKQEDKLKVKNKKLERARAQKTLKRLRKMCRNTNFRHLSVEQLIRLSERWRVPVSSIKFVKINFDGAFFGCEIYYDSSKGVKVVTGPDIFGFDWVND